MNSKDDYTTKDTLKGNIWDANWTVNIDHQHNEVQIFTDEKVNYTWFFTIGTVTPENELIARLIAAAPKMLKDFLHNDGALNQNLLGDEIPPIDEWPEGEYEELTEYMEYHGLEYINEIRINAVPVKKITES